MAISSSGQIPSLCWASSCNHLEGLYGCGKIGESGGLTAVQDIFFPYNRRINVLPADVVEYGRAVNREREPALPSPGAEAQAYHLLKVDVQLTALRLRRPIGCPLGHLRRRRNHTLPSSALHHTRLPHLTFTPPCTLRLNGGEMVIVSGS